MRRVSYCDRTDRGRARSSRPWRVLARARGLLQALARGVGCTARRWGPNQGVEVPGKYQTPRRSSSARSAGQRQVLSSRQCQVLGAVLAGALKERDGLVHNKSKVAADPVGKPAPDRPDVEPVIEESTPRQIVAPFPVVGIGASAGGIEAVKQMLHALPVNTGMAFALVQHLDPSHASMLTEILSRATSMPVSEVTDQMAVEPNHVYVIPPGMNMAISQGTLRLSPREETPGQHRVVDHFLHSLAEDRGHKAIGVILSGSATDGTLGLEAIKAEGGITFAQDDTAQHKSMPRSASAAGCVDFVLPPDEIAREIVRISRHPYVAPGAEAAVEGAREPKLNEVLDQLRFATGVDFSNYKRNTLYRRVTRRVVLHKMEGLG